MARLTADEIYAVARQAGFSPDQAVTMTAIALAESGGNPNALNPTGEHSVGLWQINMEAHGSRYGGESALYDPLTNARAAFGVSGGGSNISPWTVTHNPKGARYKSHMAAAQQASANAGEGGVGNFNGSPGYGNQVTAGAAGGPAFTGADQTGGPVAVPADATIYEVDGIRWAAFEFHGQVIAWQMDRATTHAQQPTPISAEEFQALNIHEAGSVSELATLELRDGETFTQFLDRTLTRLFPNEEAWRDPGVVSTALAFIARPDMSDAELQDLIESTAWWNARTDAQRQWDDLSEAEKDVRVDRQRQAVLDIWRRETGEALSPNDPRVDQWALDIASGTREIGGFTLEAREYALENPESPWSRTIRDEEEQQRRRGITVEDQNGFVRRMARDWGVSLSEEAIDAWALGMVELHQSEEDLRTYLRDQAAVLYPWKDAEQETRLAVEPWLQTYRRVMEREGDIFTPQIQEALQMGTPVFEFERKLMDTDEWVTTKNGRERMEQDLGAVSRLMGFS